jgi:hypothetical protein
MTGQTKVAKPQKPRDISRILDKSPDDKIMRGGRRAGR